jgi:aminopeptidase YwaD
MDGSSLEQRLRLRVATLAAKPRPIGSAAHDQAAVYIRRQLEQAGGVVTEHRFEEAGIAGTNLIATPTPDRYDLPLLIVAAHYDSVMDSPGADDNASAVAALIELAGQLGAESSRPSKTAHCRLQLVAYDLEESGLVGSYVHCREIQRAGIPVRGMISLEMLGYAASGPGSQHLPPHLAGLYPDVGNFIGICGNEASQSLLKAVVEAMKTVPGLPVEYIAVPGTGEALYETRLSDHSSFWDHGYEALMITDTSFFRNPHYHQPSDTPQTLDYAFLAKVTLGVEAAVRRLLWG